MKKLMIFAVVFFAAACCCKTIETKYEGTIPAADCPGIVYELTLSNHKDSIAGNYTLSMTYLEAENGKDMTFDSSGRWNTLQRDSKKYYQLSEDNSTTNFLVRGDSLTMVNLEFEEAQSHLNYTIIKVK